MYVAIIRTKFRNIEKAKANLKEEKSLYLAQHTIYMQEYDKQIKMLKELIEEYHKGISAIVTDVKKRPPS